MFTKSAGNLDVTVPLNPFGGSREQLCDLRLLCGRLNRPDRTGLFHLGQELTECLLDLGQLGLNDDLDA
jgi:hypothetical protein